jgi:elongation factor Ts
MGITEKIKELRERTGAGMIDCKNILVETDGDIDKAIEALREKGLAKAAKKAKRLASEGLVRIKISPDNKKAGIIEVNSETDFASKADDFISFVDALSCMTVDTDTSSIDDFLLKKYDDRQTVGEALTSLIAKIGENISVRRFTHFSTIGTSYVAYLHGEGKIGVIIGAKTDGNIEQITPILKNLAMQVASMNPIFISEDEVDPQYIDNERAILVRQALNEGKPEKIVEKIVEGRLKKELKESCLLAQNFIKDENLTVKKYIEEEAKKLNISLKIIEKVRYEVGEGLEKKEENFAEEVAKQIG